MRAYDFPKVGMCVLICETQLLHLLIPQNSVFKISRKSVQGHCGKCLLRGSRSVAEELWKGDRCVECWSHFVYTSRRSASILGRWVHIPFLLHLYIIFLVIENIQVLLLETNISIKYCGFNWFAV